jgi:ribosomal protein RSM22 (predicted rRNA methylase)
MYENYTRLLNLKIESLLEGHSLKDISKEREQLTKLYRGNDCKKNLKSLSSEHQRLAYLAARFPATYAAISHTLTELIRRSGGEIISSLLDIGAGPGTALLAAIGTCLPVERASMVERDLGFISLGKKLTEDLAQVDKNWICQDITQELKVAPHDLVIASYSLNELKEQDRLEIVEKLWKHTNKFLVIIEPGTKIAFESLKQLRKSLLLKGAHLIAPCPHSNFCPLPESDWCHFSVRIERSSLHRKTKDATLNYEDEKFSYFIFSKSKFQVCQSRVLRRPFKGEGFIKIQLCSNDGIELKTVTKKNKTQYAYSRKIEWGDEYLE